MKYLFTAPRFHTNQVPVVKGLTEMGHEVKYFVAFIGATENHAFCEPVVLKPSKITLREKKKKVKTENESKVENYFGGNFITDHRDLRQKFLSYMPDFVICRDKTYLTLSVYALCLEYGIPCVLYNQEPLFKEQENDKTVNAPVSVGFLKRITIKLNRKFNPDLRRVFTYRDTIGFPATRMTPVKYRRMTKEANGSGPTENSYFVPFVAERIEEAEHRGYFREGIIHILSVGKFRDYKNLPILIEAGKSLKVDCDFKWKMTIIGQVSNTDEEEYYKDIVRRIDAAGLCDQITIKTNIPYEKMTEEYLQNDLFILSSKKETASISVIEAMAHGLAVISTDYNGTASYIEEGKTGFIFATEDASSLAQAIRNAVECGIEKLGRNARETALRDFSWEQYYRHLLPVISAAKDSLGKVKHE